MANINNLSPDVNCIFPVTKNDVLKMLDALKMKIMDMDDFTGFPEGADGVILFCPSQTVFRHLPGCR